MGFTVIPNEILELQDKMSDPEFRVTCALLRLTIGYQQAECKTSYNQLQEMTGLSRGGVASGVSATGARGFFERIGRSGWRFLVHSVDQNSLPTRLFNELNSLPDRPEKSTSKTIPVYQIDQNTPVLKKKENIKENIYMRELPPEASPNIEHELLRADVISDMTVVCKTAYGAGINEDEYEQGAELIIKAGGAEKVRGFGDWWKSNGYYKGKPALKSMLDEFPNYLEGVQTSQGDDKNLWAEVRQEIVKNGRRSSRKWNGKIAPALRRAGGYGRLCQLPIGEAEKVFQAAYKDMEKVPA